MFTSPRLIELPLHFASFNSINSYRENKKNRHEKNAKQLII